MDLSGKSSGENQISSKLLRFVAFAHLHLIYIHEEPMNSLVLIDIF